MKRTDVIDWVDGEITTVLSNTTLLSLSSPDDHASLIEQRQPPTYPFVGIQPISSRTETGGIGNGNAVVDSLSFDANDVLQSITYRRDETLRLELVVVTDDDAKLRDGLETELEDHFAVLARKDDDIDDTLADDMDDLRLDGEATPGGRPSDFVYGTGIPIEIDYNRFITDSDVTAAETVNLDIDVGDSDTDVSESSDADAYDETFN